MKNNTHSEKEILVFNAITKLMNDGVKLHTVKVADIAKAAGIGKGTIYDYFKSKDEILEKALIYNMNIELSQVLNKISTVKGFRNKCYELLNIAQKCSRENCSSTNLLFSNLSYYEFTEILNNDKEGVENRDKLLRESIENIVMFGVDEEIIKEQEDKEYQNTVFISVMMGFLKLMENNRQDDLDEVSKAKDRSYKLLLKALN